MCTRATGASMFAKARVAAYTWTRPDPLDRTAPRLGTFSSQRLVPATASSGTTCALYAQPDTNRFEVLAESSSSRLSTVQHLGRLKGTISRLFPERRPSSCFRFLQLFLCISFQC